MKPNKTSTEEIADEVAYFDPCNYETTMDENPRFGAVVASLKTFGSESMVALENGTSMVSLDKSGEIKVTDSTKFDREKVEKIIVAASLQLSNGEKAQSRCPTATITIKLRDVNDNPPVFDRPAYHFKMENNPGNNTLVGTLKATDKDQGNNAKLSFKILNDENFNPFYMYGPDLYYLKPEDIFRPDPGYVLYVEATDGGTPKRAARATVTIDVLPPGSYEDFLSSKEKAQMNQVIEMRRKKLKPQTKERFEVAHYAFSVYGRLEHGQYVGTVMIPSKPVNYKLEDKVGQLFTINQTSGHIYVDNSTMLSDYTEVRFRVTAVRDGKDVASCTVTVLLDESQSIYEVAPRFEQVLYRFSVTENSPATDIGKVEAYHRAVTQKKEKLNYAINASSDSIYFEIDPKTGEIRTLQALDYESQKIYNLRVSACLGSHGSVCGHSDVSVIVEDVNDNPPTFPQGLYNKTVPHDLPVNSEVLRVSATDADGGKNSEISYSIVGGDGEDTFHIDEVTGQIFLDKELLSMEERHLVVEAVDKGSPPLKSNTTVIVNVGGSNPSAPEFKKFSYEKSLQAPVPIGAVLVEVKAEDPDPGLEGMVKYRLANTDSPQINRIVDKFYINPDNGKLSTMAELTEEDGSNIQLVVEAYDQSATFPRRTQTVVNLNISYGNGDHVEFSPLQKTVYISIDKPAGTRILFAPARSLQNNPLQYSIDQPGIDLFQMVGDALFTKSRLPEGEYSITLKATTSTGNTGVHQLRIVAMKDREKYPVFSQLNYDAKIDESEGFPIKLDVVRATQARGAFKYTLFPDNSITGVSIDEETGVITIDKSYVDTHVLNGPLFLVVRAINQNDPKFFSDAGVTIKLSDGAQTFSFPTKLYRMQLSEASEVNTILSTPVRLINIEFGTESVTYTIEPSEYFAFDNQNRLKLIKPLNLEKLPKSAKGILDLIVTAHYGNESASTNVQIKVTDDNEFFPMFDHDYAFELGDHVPGEIIGTVSASDLDPSDDGALKYNKTSGDPEEHITVLQNGSLVLNSLPDRNFSLDVTAFDSVGNSAEVRINIVGAATSVPPGTPSAAPPSTSSSSSTASIQPAQTSTQPSVPESPSETPSTEPQTTTETMSAPVVNELPTADWEIPEGQSLENASFVINVPDATKKWRFSIPVGNEDDLFELAPIDHARAQLQFIAESELSEESTERKIVIEGVDENDPNNRFRANVIVKFPEKRSLPVFEPLEDELKVNTSVPEDEALYKVSATVPEGSEPVVYSLEENPDDQFKIDPKTGEISYAVDEDHRKDGLYNLIVKAESGGKTSELTVPVEIDKVQPHEIPAPSFGKKEYKYSISENPQQEATLGQLQINGMTDSKDLIVRFKPEWANQVLEVDPETKTIKLKHIPDSLLKNDFSHLKVTAENVQDPKKSSTVSFSLALPQVSSPTPPQTVPTRPTQSQATMTSTEETKPPTEPPRKTTDSSTTTTERQSTAGSTVVPVPIPGIGPRFNKNEYRSTMLEGHYGGGTVLTLKPESFKVIGMSKPVYSIETDDSYLPFYIRNDTGQLIITSDVDRERNPSYTFKVVATNPENPEEQGKASVKITILDVNDNYPRFVGGPKLIAINDSLPMNTVLAIYEAVDDDEGPSGKVTYRLRNNKKNLFSISPKGELQLANPLRSSNETFYDIIVEAMDGGRPALKTPYQVHIEVFSAVDSAPLFKDEMYEATVPVDVETGFIVTELVAGTRNYTYSLPDSFSQLFIIEDNGVVMLGRKPIESEQNSYKVLNVTATDEQGRSSTTQLNVFFEGKPIVVNSSASTTTESPAEPGPCQFTSKIFNAEIRENLSERQNVTRVTSNCEAAHKNVRYAIVQATKEFEIDEVTGVVSVNAPLDREKRSTHFIIVNLTEVTEETESQERNIRHTPVIHPIADFMKNKLSPGQSMIVLQVLDENDNAPTFLKVNRGGEYVFSIDAQVDPPNAIARVYAFDPDEKAKVTYNISESTPTEYFMVNETNGVVYLRKPLTQTRYKFTAVASDGLHETAVPVWIYTISMENNIAVVVSDKNRDDINEAISSKKLSEMLNAEVKIVDKKPYSDNQGNFDTQRSLLYVYAIDKQSRVPLTGSELKTMLSQQMDHLGASELRVSGISLPVSGMKITTTELILLIICAILLFTACITIFLLARYCKRRYSIPQNDDEYMVDSQSAGPRPYNVETISRQVAQNMLSSRPLPDPFEDHKAQITYGVAGPRSKHFSGDVQSVHALIRTRREGKVGPTDPVSTLNQQQPTEHFPVYRSQGYGNCC
ncbi:hypothetical protein L596_006490 [Steinernema carpocapsae]|uniref:Cadherin domain-containing protein n=1 Tax=Steinernema carpocapsae TaxID=34508 RepID=A0A4U8V2B5_STECR|nr:hypothetical protein L596_006490 [Steinernema carpocapsae]